MLDQLRSGDTLVVWKLDRLSCSLKDLLTILERVSATGAKFKSLTERSTPPRKGIPRHFLPCRISMSR